MATLPLSPDVFNGGCSTESMGDPRAQKLNLCITIPAQTDSLSRLVPLAPGHEDQSRETQPWQRTQVEARGQLWQESS
jgi:hypothetical protein